MKVWKKKVFPTRGGAIAFFNRKAVANLPYWELTTTSDKKGRLIEVKQFIVEYVGRK